MELSCEQEELTCVGTFQMIHEGEMLEVQGEFVEHSAYGRQLKVLSFTEKTPQDSMAMERYLGSGAIKGVGKALAARIVRRFGKDTFRIIEEEPERLTEVKGISERIARQIAQQMQEKADLRNVMLVLQQYGITMSLGVRLYKQYGSAVCEILRENPYRLAEDIQGIGFKMADEIAGRIGIHRDSDYRIRSGLFYILTQASAQGHMYLPRQILMERTSVLLGLSPQQLEKSLMDLLMERKVILKKDPQEGDRIYAQQYYHIELDTARLLMELNLSGIEKEASMERTLKAIEKETQVCLDDLQKEAVMQAASHGLFILTGGPGTGKTTTINAMIRYFEKQNLKIALAAPTGRAAKRMTETTGRSAQTIHRLLELNGKMEDENGQSLAGRVHFERNAMNPLEYDVVIIDEMSMVDIFLMHSLLQAMVPGTRLILSGDVNQLPSVGPGRVLGDMIEADCFCVVRLHRIFRQAAMSDIVVNAHRINAGLPVDNKSRDFFFLKRYDADTIIRVMLTLMTKKLPSYVGADMLDIQVLTPTRKGLLGVERLNEILQAVLNPRDVKKPEKETVSGVFRQGDKVMQIKNNYQLEWEVRDRYGIPVDKGTGVFNGDIGFIREINTFAETVTVEFDDRRMVEYDFKLLDELELAYAVTIHKSQGSEYPAVLIPLLAGPKMLMNRNLLYTAVTRAKKCVTLVGSDEVFAQMVANKMQQSRYTSLKDRLQEWAD